MKLPLGFNPARFKLPDVLPPDIHQALLPFTTLAVEKELQFSTRNASKQLEALQAIDPQTLSQQLITRLEGLPGAKTFKKVFLAEQAEVRHPRLNTLGQQAQQWMRHPHWPTKGRGFMLKALIDSVNSIVSTITSLGRKLTAIASDLLERSFSQASQRGKRLTDGLKGKAEAHPLSRQLQAIQLAGEKGEALVASLRRHLAEDHPQFSDAGVQHAYDEVKRVHQAERRALRTDDLALRWLTVRPGGRYLTRPASPAQKPLPATHLPEVDQP
jgi:hypothetical protein